MAYTNSWSNTVPAGSAAANTIDDAIKQLRLDIQERMDALVDDWTADPVVLTTTADQTVTRFYHHSILRPVNDEDDVDVEQLYTESDNDTAAHLRGHIALPVGCVLTDFDVVIDIQSATSGVVKLYYEGFTSSPGITQVGSLTETVSGVRVSAVVDGGSHTVETARMYFVECVPGSAHNIRIYGFRATFTVADLGDYL